MPGYGPGPAGYTAPQYTAPQYTTPQVAYNQNAGNGYSGQSAPYGAPNAYAPQGPFSAPAQQTGYGAYPQQAGTGSYIPQTPYSPGYVSPNYQAPANGYAQPGGYQQPNVYQQPNGYTQPGGYQPPMNGYPGTYPASSGAFQNPPNGYPQPGGYQQPGGYMPGYDPYGQMGRSPQQGQSQNETIPLNGGGYIPQRVPVRKRGFEIRDWHLIAAGALLIALFVAGVLVFKSIPLKILLILLAAGSAGMLWVRTLTAENKRLTYSILALALCIMTAVSFLMKPNTDVTNTPGEQSQNAGNNTSGSSGTENGVPEIPANSQTGQSASDETPVPEQSEDRELMERLVSFFNYWHGNRLEEMLDLCAPSWKEKQESPRTSLFSLMANRTPTECTPESITGTAADTSRKVTLKVLVDRNNAKPKELYRMTIMMVKESNEWYVDPQSLLSNESLETPDPNITPTPAPTNTPAVFSNTQLYYNPKGGEYYHLDPNCKIINPKFLPLGGTFTYSQIGDDPYNKLKPCNVCGAPLPPE